MGNWFSSQPDTLEVKQILNKLLNDMMRRSDLRDLYSLADPQKCSNYIVVGAKALHKLFSSIQLEVRKGEEGKIYFQKIDALRKVSDLKSQQMELCKMLAFYFVRIFRIYGALTLSILDSDVPTVDPVETVQQQTITTHAGIPHLAGFPQRRRSWFGWGGQLKDKYYLKEEDVGVYKILNSCLIVPSDGISALRFAGQDGLSIKQEELYMKDSSGNLVAKKFADSGVPRPFVFYYFKSDDKNRQMDGRLVLTQSGGIEVKLEDIKLDSEMKRVDLDPVTINSSSGFEGQQLPDMLQKLFIKAFEMIEPPKFYPLAFFKKYGIINSTDGEYVRLGSTPLYINGPQQLKRASEIPITYSTRVSRQRDSRDSRDNDYRNRNDRREQSIQVRVTIYISIEQGPDSYRLVLGRISATPDEYESIVQNMRFEDASFSAQGGRLENTKGRSISEYLEKFMERAVKKDSEQYRIDSRGFLPAPTIRTADPYYNVTGLWKGLVRAPPVKAHCIARAVQLLNVAAIQNPSTGEAYSNVCRIKFPYITNGSLPTPEQSVLTEDGIDAMAKLYVDRFVNGQLIPTKSKEYDEFRRKLTYLFGRERPEDVPQAPESFDKIIDKQVDSCTGVGDKRLMIKGALVGRLRQRSLSLIQQQKVHIARVMQLLFKLFDEKSLRSGAEFQINEYILSSGMDGLNRLAEEARNLLINYYSQCEGMYKEGLMDIRTQMAGEKGAVKTVVPM